MKTLAIAVLVLVLSSLAGALNGTVSWHTTFVSDGTAILALVLTYLKGYSGS